MSSPSTNAPSAAGRYILPRACIAPSETEFGKLGLGCWALGGQHWGGQDVQDARAVLEVAFRRGIVHLDTSAAYGDGRSETIIGEFFRRDSLRRGHVFLATKAAAGDMTAGAMERSLEASLERIGDDQVDLFYVDWPPAGADVRPLLEPLIRAHEAGRVKAIGVSNFSLAQFDQAREVCPIHACQAVYNLIWRNAEAELIPYCREHQIAFVAAAGLGQGVLAGRFGREPVFAAGDLRARTVPFDSEVWPRVHEAVEEMRAVAAQAGRPLLHLALRWLLRRSEVTCVLAGARHAVQVNEIAGAAEGWIDDAPLDRLTAISDGLQPALPAAGNLFRYHPA